MKTAMGTLTHCQAGSFPLLQTMMTEVWQFFLTELLLLICTEHTEF